MIVITLNMICSVKYYLDLHISIPFTIDVLFLLSKDVDVLYCPNNQSNLFWYKNKMRYTINNRSIVYIPNSKRD